MSTITDAINMADGARQAGNLDMAIRILIDTLRAIDAGRARITPNETGAVITARQRGLDIATTSLQLGISEGRVRRILQRWDRMYPYDRRGR